MQEKIIEELRQELKAQTDENQELLKINEEHKKLNGELRKEIDGLVTVIDLAKEYINKYLEEHVIEDQPDEQSIFYDEKGFYIPNAKEQLLEILESVNEK